MDVFRSGTDVKMTVAFVDDTGTTINVASASYRVLDENRVEVVAVTALTVNAGDTSTQITVLAANNALPTGAIRAGRTIEITMVDTNGNTKTTSASYVIETTEVLGIMTNSYQTLENAEIVAFDLPELERWNSATVQQKRAALVEAYHRLGNLAYRVGWNQSQDQLSFPFWSIRNLNEWTKTEFDRLPPKFKLALNRAQVTEADMILGADDIGELRRDGLMSQSIGESSQMYRPGKPIMLPVSIRALRKLSGYVTFNPVIGR